ACCISGGRCSTLEFHLLALELRGGFLDIRRGEDDARTKTEIAGRNDLNGFAGISGEDEARGVVVRWREAELLDVEGARSGGVVHGERDHGHPVAHAVGAEVLANVLG